MTYWAETSDKYSSIHLLFIVLCWNQAPYDQTCWSWYSPVWCNNYYSRIHFAPDDIWFLSPFLILYYEFLRTKSMGPIHKETPHSWRNSAMRNCSAEILPQLQSLCHECRGSSWIGPNLCNTHCTVFILYPTVISFSDFFVQCGAKALKCRNLNDQSESEQGTSTPGN